MAKSSAVFYHSTMKKYDVVQHNNRHHCKYLVFYVFHVEVVFITGHEEDWGSGKRKRKLKGARRRKRNKHFLISPLPSPLTLLFYSFSRPCFPRFIDWLHELKIKFELSDNSFFQFSPKKFLFFSFLKSAFLWSLTHFPPCCSRYCVRTSCGTKIERTKKGRAARKKEKKKRLLLTLFAKYLRRLYDPSIEIIIMVNVFGE